jgi:threonyl-tRNA synthetase
VQVRTIPIADDMLGYASEVLDVLTEAGLRADLDTSDNRLPAKVRNAVTRKIPLILVLGRREAQSGSVAVRFRSGRETQMPLTEFVDYATEQVRTRSLEGAGHIARQASAANEA